MAQLHNMVAAQGSPCRTAQRMKVWLFNNVSHSMDCDLSSGICLSDTRTIVISQRRSDGGMNVLVVRPSPLPQ